MIKTHTTYTFEHQEHTFPIPFEFCEGSEMVHLSDDGLTAVLGVLDQDTSPQDPFEVFGEGEFYQFNSRYIHDTDRPDIEDFKRIIRANPGRVFAIDGGDSSYYVARNGAPFTVKDTHNQTPHDDESSVAATCLKEMDGYYICPEDVTDPASYAKSAIEQYTQFCQGEDYGVCVWTYTREATDAAWELDEEDRDECWGFYGYEYAEQSLKEYFDNALNRLKPQ